MESLRKFDVLVLGSALTVEIVTDKGQYIGRITEQQFRLTPAKRPENRHYMSPEESSESVEIAAETEAELLKAVVEKIQADYGRIIHMIEES